MQGTRMYKVFRLVLVGSLALMLTGCPLLPVETVDAPPPLLQPPAPRIVTHTVTRGYIAQEISALARVAAINEESLFFTQRGRIAAILVKYNEWVEPGQAIAYLEAGDLDHRHALAKLDLERDMLRLNRLQTLAETEGFVNPYDLRMAEIDYEKTRLNFERLDKQLQAITIYATIRGQVTAINMRVAETVEEFKNVITIADPTELQLMMNLNTQQLRLVAPGQLAKVRLPSNADIDADVVQVPTAGGAFSLGQADTTAILRVRDPNVKLNFNALLQTRILIQEREDAIILPKAALREFQGRTFVRILEGDTRREVDVEVGIQSQTHVEIVKGLEEGQQIIAR